MSCNSLENCNHIDFVYNETRAEGMLRNQMTPNQKQTKIYIHSPIEH